MTPPKPPALAESFASARTIQRQISAGVVTPAGICDAVLERVRTGDCHGAFVQLGGDALRRAAGQLATPSSEQTLAGIPVAVKDIFDTADMPTAYGSDAYAGHLPACDAAVVAELRSRGALIIGKTATTEFAAWPPSRARNPADPARTPGGSSAGSAAAVAAGLVPLALGTQTLGSVIRPASYCGVVGFKPSFGRISRSGVKPLAESLDTIGFFARDVADIDLLYTALVPGRFREPAPTGRLALFRGPHWELADADARAAFDAGIARLRARGLAIEEPRLPENFAEISAAGRLVHDYELGRGLFADLIGLGSRISPSMRAGITRGRARSPDDHARARLFLEQQRTAFADFMRPFDAILCLAATGEAPIGFDSTGDPILNIPWTALHAPCLTLPVLRGRSGLPIGLQIVADRYQERMLLMRAAEIETLFSGQGAILA